MDQNKDLFLNSFYDSANDQLLLLMKDVDSQTKRITKIDKPKLDIYRLNKKTDIFMDYILEKNADKVQIHYRNKSAEIAKLLGIDPKTYWDVVRKDKKKSKALKLNKVLFGLDINIEDQYLMKYMDSFNHYMGSDGYMFYEDTPPIRNLHKGYLDAEWDYTKSDDKNDHNIYLITYVDGKAKVCYTYYCYNKEYKDIDYIEENKEAYLKRIKDNMNEHIKLENLDIDHGKAVKIQPILQDIADRMQYIIKKYDDEAEMLKDIYQLAYREYKPDFLDIYNAEADIGQSIRRYEYYGGDIKDLFTCPEIGDTIDFNMDDDRYEPNERNHTYNSSSYTKLMCSYQRYYSLRGHEKYSNRGLSDTALREIGMTKLSFKHICSTIGELPYLDFPLAMEYNIRDVVLMDFMESCINDIEYALALRFLKTTDYDRLYIPMIGVYNVFYHISMRNGKIMGNNVNGTLNSLTDEELKYFKERDPYIYKLAKAVKNRKKIVAGLCSGPTRFKGAGRKDMLSFLSSLVVRNIFDMDATSEYPNAIITGMMAKSTIYGRIKQIMGEEISDSDMSFYTQAMINRDDIAICREFFNLPGCTEILKELKYDIPTLNKVSFHKEDIISFIDALEYHDRFTKLNSILSKITNPKQDKKDLDTHEIPLRGVYIMNNSDEVVYKYFGSLIKYNITNNTNEIVPPLNYIGYTGNLNEVVVDTVEKSINNTNIHEMLPDINNRNIIEDKPLQYIGTFDLSDILFDICNPRKLLKNRLEYNGTVLSVPSRFIAFPIGLCVNEFDKKIESFTHIPKPALITKSTDIRFRYGDNIQCTRDIDNIEYGINTMEFTNNKNKVKTLELDCIEFTYHVYKVKDIKENNIYKGIFKYSINLDQEHMLNISQEFYFLNYIE